MARPLQRHIDFLDPVRGIAILLVFLYHVLGMAFGGDQLPWGPWFRDFTGSRSFFALLPVTFGWAGVVIFFVVSGFCIHLSFSRRADWMVFFQRRFFRIYPPYLVVLLFFALAYPITRLHFTSWEDGFQLFSHLTLIYNTNAQWVFGINPSFWSIAVEVQLYVLYPVLCLLASRFGWRRALLGIATLEIGLRLAYGVMDTLHGTGLPRWVTDSPFYFWFSWALGAWLAELYLQGKTWLVPRLLFYALVVMPFACWFLKPLASLSFPLFAMLTAAVMSRLLEKTPRQLPLPGILVNHLQRVGLWSFSLYLVHQPLILGIPCIVGKVTSDAYVHPLVMFLLGVASWFVIVPLARLLYQFLELPSIALGKQFYLRNP